MRAVLCCGCPWLHYSVPAQPFIHAPGHGLLNASILSIPCKTREIQAWSLTCSRMEGFEMGLMEGFEMSQALKWLQQRNQINVCQKSRRESWQISKTDFNWCFWRGRYHVGPLMQEAKFRALQVEEDVRWHGLHGEES